jgi:hypothetical protein
VAFEDLRAEGGLMVSARREGGRTTRVSVKAPEAGTPAAQAVTTVRILDPFDGDITPTWSKPPRETRKGGEGGRAIMVFDLGPGESVEGVEGSVRGAP